ncbi:MAG: GAF domain-containing protein, partial [Sphingomicrobium sp.]
IFRDGSGYGIDAEPSDGHAFGDPTAIVEGMLARVAAARDVASIGNEAARQLRALTGFDRVLVVGCGNLLGQSIRPGQDEYEPVILEANVAHLAISDSKADPVSILTHHRNSPSSSTLRVATEGEAIVIESLNARAALIMPLLRDGKAWGHIGCYHGAGRHIGVERRSVACLFARFIALQLEVAELRAS